MTESAYPRGAFPRRVLAEERRIVSLTALLHGVVHANILSVPVFLERAWRTEFGADDVTLGLLASTAYVAFGVGSVPFGFLADRYPAPRLLALCVSGILGGLAALSLSPGLASVAGSLAVLGLFSGIYHPTGLSLISRGVRKQGRGMGWHGVGGSLGIALGPAAVGGLLGLGWPWRSAAAVLMVPPAAGLAVLVLSGLRDPIPARTREPLLRSLRAVLAGSLPLVLLVYVCAGIAYWGSLTFLPRFVGTESYVVLLALGAVGQLASGHLADRARPERVLLILSLLAASLLLTLAFPVFVGFPSVAWGFGLLIFSLEPLQNTLVASAVPPGRRGLAFGLTFLSVFGLGSVGAALAGILLQSSQAGLLFTILAGSLAMSGAFGLLAGRASRKND